MTSFFYVMINLQNEKNVYSRKFFVTDDGTIRFSNSVFHEFINPYALDEPYKIFLIWSQFLGRYSQNLFYFPGVGRRKVVTRVTFLVTTGGKYNVPTVVGMQKVYRYS